jgi:hypothetical protein
MAIKDQIKQQITSEIYAQLNKVEAKAEVSNIDLQYFDSIIVQIESLDACGDLQFVINDVMHIVQKQIYDIEQQLAQMSPLLALLELSITDLPGVIHAVEKIVENMVAPYVIPYAKYIGTAAAIIVEIAKLTKAVDDAAKRIKGNCNIHVPELIFTPNLPTASAYQIVQDALNSFTPPIDPNNPPTSI